MTGHDDRATALRTLTGERVRRLHLADARTLGYIDSALWYHTSRHGPIHRTPVAGCPMCDLLTELRALLTTGGQT